MCIINPDPKRGGKRSGRTDELRYLPHTSRLSSWPPSLCCTESEDSSDSNSENLYQEQLVFSFHPMCFFFVIRCSTHCHQTLPTAQVTPALTDSFSRGHDPFAHACKARPLTIVGWTSLSVSLSLSLSPVLPLIIIIFQITAVEMSFAVWAKLIRSSSSSISLVPRRFPVAHPVSSLTCHHPSR